MAFVALPTATGSIRMRDASGSVGSFRVHIPDGTLASVALTALDVIATTIALIVGASVIGYDLTYTRNDDAPATPDAGSRVEDKGVFIWRTANGRSTRFEVPAILDSVLNTSGTVNLTNADIISLVAAVTGVGTIFAGADGSDITSLLEAYQRFNSTTKRQAPPRR